ncbi:uncharacterized protein CLUP02_07529 [Colletotrichum lupini]|uniref:Uncharacterized protein n=1 Tax=Colletotrichum lupini TaxID=145971 RepID=A0A9Q8WFR8_9PEZI|nr:uncharacterized protein CLUP02_07529 [Colletotrichum lupini]UQC82043.1 hypothetical protein CLUP02_07529 [Colletotrichum lupini]
MFYCKRGATTMIFGDSGTDPPPSSTQIKHITPRNYDYSEAHARSAFVICTSWKIGNVIDRKQPPRPRRDRRDTRLLAFANSALALTYVQSSISSAASWSTVGALNNISNMRDRQAISRLGRHRYGSSIHALSLTYNEKCRKIVQDKSVFIAAAPVWTTSCLGDGRDIVAKIWLLMAAINWLLKRQNHICEKLRSVLSTPSGSLHIFLGKTTSSSAEQHEALTSEEGYAEKFHQCAYLRMTIASMKRKFRTLKAASKQAFQKGLIASWNTGDIQDFQMSC